VLSGAKYVIRTEVLYAVGKAGRGGADLDAVSGGEPPVAPAPLDAMRR
jgi:hypothetical protein